MIMYIFSFAKAFHLANEMKYLKLIIKRNFFVLKDSETYKVFKIYLFNWRLSRRVARCHEFF